MTAVGKIKNIFAEFWQSATLFFGRLHWISQSTSALVLPRHEAFIDTREIPPHESNKRGFSSISSELSCFHDHFLIIVFMTGEILGLKTYDSIEFLLFLSNFANWIKRQENKLFSQLHFFFDFHKIILDSMKLDQTLLITKWFCVFWSMFNVYDVCSKFFITASLDEKKSRFFSIFTVVLLWSFHLAAIFANCNLSPFSSDQVLLVSGTTASPS